jgi:hypothetical protein
VPDVHARYLSVARESRLEAARRPRIADAPDSAAWIASSGGHGSRDNYIMIARAYLAKAFIARAQDRRRLP